MYGITELRKDTLIDIDGQPYRVNEYKHTQLGRGGAVVRLKLKNLLTRQTVDKTFKNDQKVKPAEIKRRKLQYLYTNRDNFFFMDSNTFEPETVDQALEPALADFIPEGQEVIALVYENRVISFELPNNTALRVVSAAAGVKGDTATSATKIVELETGLKMAVPLFIKKGDRVKVDTRSGRYLERAK